MSQRRLEADIGPNFAFVPRVAIMLYADRVPVKNTRSDGASEDNHPKLLVPFYSFALVMFFAYCYPIARLTIALERKYAVKL